MQGKKLDQIIDWGLQEDLGIDGDITSNLTIPEDKIINFKISNREKIILCGSDIALRIFEKISGPKLLKKYSILTNSKPILSLKKHFNDGDTLEKNSVIIEGKGNAKIIFAAERLILNLMQHLSGIATKTHEFTSQIQGKTKILDTRKTIPPLRELQKYAVKIGGGKNHRMALHDGILIKDNHIAACGNIKNAIEAVRNNLKTPLLVEVECDNLEQVAQALEVKADIIMLDNMNLEKIEKAVKLINGQAKIEVSGNMTLEKITPISKLGVDYISVGALTHSVKAADIGLDVY